MSGTEKRAWGIWSNRLEIIRIKVRATALGLKRRGWRKEQEEHKYSREE
jgi:hypothetical protein